MAWICAGCGDFECMEGTDNGLPPCMIEARFNVCGGTMKVLFDETRDMFSFSFQPAFRSDTNGIDRLPMAINFVRTKVLWEDPLELESAESFLDFTWKTKGGASNTWSSKEERKLAIKKLRDHWRKRMGRQPDPPEVPYLRPVLKII